MKMIPRLEKGPTVFFFLWATHGHCNRALINISLLSKFSLPLSWKMLCSFLPANLFVKISAKSFRKLSINTSEFSVLLDPVRWLFELKGIFLLEKF